MPRVPASPDSPKPRELVPCGACIFWQPTHDGAGSGKCVRYPPVGGGPSQLPHFPTTHPTTTCGEGATR